VLRLGPLRLHWSLLLGAALFCALQPRPLFVLGYATVVLAHVLGHALAVAGTGLRVEGAMLHALGGELLGTGDVSPPKMVCAGWSHRKCRDHAPREDPQRPDR